MAETLWIPDEERVANARLTAFMEAAPGQPTDYHELWRWSIAEPDAFWRLVWEFGGVIGSQEPDAILEDPAMPGARWFRGARLNFAENLLRRDDDNPAVIGVAEGKDDEVVAASELRARVGKAQAGLRALGVEAGDTVAACVPNCVDAVVLMLAATALGATWSSSSPDFGAQGVIDRFAQVGPKVMVVADGYRYRGEVFALQEKVDGIVAAIDSLAHVVVVDFAGQPLEVRGVPSTRLGDLGEPSEPQFAQLPPDHPLYVMFSSGTTGRPKSIVHGAAGTLVKHLAEHQLAFDIGRDSTVFWFTTCGWMMWNWLVSALASGACIVCYDGAPDVRDTWRMVERLGITHFGTSPKFLAACQHAGVVPRHEADLSSLEAIGSTGAPLAPEQFDWVYANVHDDVPLMSVSGGTDIIGCFAAGVPTLPVRRGELQARALGMAVEAWDSDGNPVIGQQGELVCTKPFPSMPLGLLHDPDGKQLYEAYYAANPGVWTHGDWIEIRPEGGVVIHGRSDTTLNPGGVRIGTAELYRALQPMEEVVDAIAVGRDKDGDVEIVLAVVLAEGVELDDALVAKIKDSIRQANTPRHVPRHVVAVPDIPYTLSGKKVEKAVRTVLEGGTVDNADALANPQALDHFRSLLLG